MAIKLYSSTTLTNSEFMVPYESDIVFENCTVNNCKFIMGTDPTIDELNSYPALKIAWEEYLSIRKIILGL